MFLPSRRAALFLAGAALALTAACEPPPRYVTRPAVAPAPAQATHRAPQTRQSVPARTTRPAAAMPEGGDGGGGGGGGGDGPGGWG